MLAARIGEDRGERRPVDSRQGAEKQLRCHHGCAGVAGADHRLRLAFAHQIGADDERRVALAAHDGRRIVHFDALLGVDDLDPRAGIRRAAQPLELALEALRITHQQNRNSVLEGAFERSAHRGARSEVASHRVDGDAHRGIGNRSSAGP